MINIYCLRMNFYVVNLGINHWSPSGNRNKGKGKGDGLAWASQSHCFADEIGIPYTHSFGTDTQHDYSQGSCRTKSSIISKLERLVYCKL